ncbi:hypothetical protein TYRP_003776 [Tyrophagus putrescentiae]|nr:hypothetical protein TYRP_003776 [Tyrophagus putrescentiae]
MPPPLLLITPAGALCFDGEDHHKSRRRRRPGLSLTLFSFGWRPHPSFVVVAKKEDHLKSHRQCHHGLSHSRSLRMAPTPAHRAEDHHHHHHLYHQSISVYADALHLSFFPFLLFPSLGSNPWPATDDDPDGWRPGWRTTRMDGDQDGGRPGPTTMKTEDERDGRPGWTSRMDGNEDRRRRKLKTEDRRPTTGRRGRQQDGCPAEEAVDTGGRSAEKVGNTSHKWCAASAWSVSTALSSLHICWVIKRSGPSRYYCPSSDVGGPKRTVDKDGRLSEDGEADG